MVRREVTVLLVVVLLLVFVGLPYFRVDFGKENEQTANILDSIAVKFSQEKTDENRKANQNSSSSNCSVRLAAPNTFPLTMLVSLPGSGNTWTRHLIEQATGFYTGSVYNNRKLYEGGLLGELEYYMAGTTLTVKTHRVARLASVPKAAILIIRNPIDSAIAERNRKLTSSHTEVASWDRSLRFDKGWNRQAQLNDFENMVNYFVELQVQSLVVHYENLKEHTLKEVWRIVKFLNMTMSKEREMCVTHNAEGNFHRKPGDIEAPYEAFTDQMKCKALDAMRRVSMVLVKKGHDPLPCLQEHPVSGCDLFSKAVSSISNCTADNSTLS
ncbi:sialate:O-sulfotransferase 1-like isoform X1 [Ptychodera flava]|uniref:sialate:O-sulfotransferase 1-like isoform X1 n=1 Tax=Ptychodera flava TaxID=63121 RepID=UPI00396A1169